MENEISIQLSVKIPNNITEINDIRWNAENNLLVFLFELSECVPCDTMFVRLKNVLQDIKDVLIVRVDIAKAPEITQEYDIIGVPTIVAEKSNLIIDRFVGMKDEDYIRTFIIQAKEKVPEAQYDVKYHIKTEKDFESIVLKNSNPVLVYFCAVWCIPCKLLSPILEKVLIEHKKDFEEMTLAKVDCDDAQELAMKYNVTFLPTLILFKDGREMKRLSGMQSEDVLVKFIESSTVKN